MLGPRTRCLRENKLGYKTNSVSMIFTVPYSMINSNTSNTSSSSQNSHSSNNGIYRIPMNL